MRKTIQLWVTVLVLTIGSSMALTSCSNEDHAVVPSGHNGRACQVLLVVGPAVVGDAFTGGTFSSLVVDVGHTAIEACCHFTGNGVGLRAVYLGVGQCCRHLLFK